MNLPGSSRRSIAVAVAALLTTLSSISLPGCGSCGDKIPQGKAVMAVREFLANNPRSTLFSGSSMLKRFAAALDDAEITDRQYAEMTRMERESKLQECVPLYATYSVGSAGATFHAYRIDLNITETTPMPGKFVSKEIVVFVNDCGVVSQLLVSKISFESDLLHCG